MKKKIVPAILLACLFLTGGLSFAGSFSFTLEPNSYEIIKDQDGHDNIIMAGYGHAGVAGNGRRDNPVPRTHGRIAEHCGVDSQLTRFRTSIVGRDE